ncbi:NACHT domain-containing protein [Actinoplanes sp. NPDC023936]|uniref:NACHT domain-containing protein n=1 Tax=Actinoplanes sp. NPDC023936 TaxID=3154910 RepID=UPI00340B075D
MLRPTTARRLALIGVAGVALGVFGLSRFTNGLSTGDQVASIVSAVATLVGLAATFVFGILSLRQGRAATDEAAALDRAAGTLALRVRRQWEREIGKRRLRQPRPLRLTWNRTATPLGPAAFLPDEGSLLIDDSTRQPAADLVDAFRRLPARQLVVLGEPGAGKSTLAMLFTIAALPAAAPSDDAGQPVPVLLSLASWDPGEELRAWAGRAVAETYPEVAASALPLIDQNRVLLVLDGLDELPAPVRRQAARHLGDAADVEGLPMVITCRRTEYDEVVAAEGRLPLAAEVTIAPVTGADAIAFLTAGEPEGGGRWESVTAAIRSDEYGPLATALSTPLMISLARTVYRAPASDPGELARLGSAGAVREHLLSRFVPAVYRNSKIDVGRAERYLRTLAQHLRFRIHRPNLAWWELARAVPAAVLVVPLVLLLGAVGTITGVLTWWDDSTSRYAAVFGWAVGMTSGLIAGLHVARAAHEERPAARGRIRAAAGHLATLFRDVAAAMILAGPPMLVLYRMRLADSDGVPQIKPPGPGLLAVLTTVVIIAAVQSLISSGLGAVRGALPVRSQWRLSQLPGRLIAGLGLGASIGTVFGLVVGTFAGTLRISDLDDPTVGVFWGMLQTGGPLGLAVALGFTLMIGLPVGVGLWLTTPVNDETMVSPRAVLRSDALTSLIIAVTGAVAAAAIGVTATIADVDYESGGLDPIAAVVSVVCILVGGLLLGSGAPWVAYAIAHAWLAIWRLLPWRTMQFLEEAHEHEILRQIGAVYQFRHDLLEVHLAGVHRPRRPLSPASPTFTGPEDLALDSLRRHHRTRAGTAAASIIVLLTSSLIIVPNVDLGLTFRVGELKSRHADLLAEHADELTGSDPGKALELRIAAAELDSDDGSLTELGAVVRARQADPDAGVVPIRQVVSGNRWLLTLDHRGLLEAWDNQSVTPASVLLGQGDLWLAAVTGGALVRSAGQAVYWDLSGAAPRSVPLRTSDAQRMVGPVDGIVVVRDYEDHSWVVDVERPEVPQIDLGEGLYDVTILPGRRWVLADQDGVYLVVDLHTGKRAEISEESPTSATLFGTALHLATGSGQGRLWDMSTWPPAPIPIIVGSEDLISSDGRWVFSYSQRPEALLTRAGGPAETVGQQVTNAAFDAAGGLIVHTSDGRVLRRDLDDPRRGPSPLASGIVTSRFLAAPPNDGSDMPGTAAVALATIDTAGRATFHDLRRDPLASTTAGGRAVDVEVQGGGEWALVRHDTGRVSVWNVRNGPRRIGELIISPGPTELMLQPAPEGGGWIWTQDANATYLAAFPPFRRTPALPPHDLSDRDHRAGGAWATLTSEGRMLAWSRNEDGNITAHDFGGYTEDVFPATNGRWALLFSHRRAGDWPERQLMSIWRLDRPMPPEARAPKTAACAEISGHRMTKQEWDEATDGLPHHRVCPP